MYLLWLLPPPHPLNEQEDLGEIINMCVAFCRFILFIPPLRLLFLSHHIIIIWVAD